MKRPKTTDLISMILIVVMLALGGWGALWMYRHDQEQQRERARVDRITSDALLAEMSKREQEQARQDELDDLEEMTKELEKSEAEENDQ